MPQSKTKTCQNCKSKFTIEPEDFEFYKKIDVPEPTFCPECRMQRRMVWRNERNLYKRKCDFSNKDIISIYHKDSPIKSYEQKIWWSDKWDPMEYGMEYDFNKPFFTQMRELMEQVPWPALTNTDAVNSDYCNFCEHVKDCYLVFGAHQNENLMYARGTYLCKDSMELHNVDKNELCYQNIDTQDCYKVFFSQNVIGCNSSAFLYDCRNCQDCFGCVGLRNKKYHIFNKPYSKGEYQKEIKKYQLNSYQDLLEIQEKFNKFKLEFPNKYANLYKTSNVIGDNVNNAKNCYSCFDLRDGIEDCKYASFGGAGLKDVYDMYGGGKGELMYEGVNVGISSSRELFAVSSFSCRQAEYVLNCHSGSNLFGCVGLRHKKYCILNKQYTKEEYEELVPKIKKHMDQMPYLDKKKRVYKYGEYFPIELGPFAYNETLASEHFPLIKEQALAEKYSWFDKSGSEYEPNIKAKDLPDDIKDVDDGILNQVIECGHIDNCFGSGVFRIIPKELKFYQRHNLSLPRLCPDCRHQERVGMKNPMKLWKRQCQCAGEKSSNKLYKNTIEHSHKNKPCPNTFQTTYAPERKEIVYCEKCYLKEVG